MDENKWILSEHYQKLTVLNTKTNKEIAVITNNDTLVITANEEIVVKLTPKYS